MDFQPVKKAFGYKFDFDVGYLIKSPCKQCDTLEYFPGCSATCDLLDQIHAILSEAVSCSKK